MIEHLICKALKEAIFQSMIKLWSAQVLTHCPVILGAFNSVHNISPYGPILFVWSPILSVGYGIIMDKKNRCGFKLWTNYFGPTSKKRLRYGPQIRIKCKRMTRCWVSKY